MRGLTPATRQRIRDALESGPFGTGGVEFAEAVVGQTAHPLGRGPEESNPESAAADRVLALLQACVGDDRSVAAAADDLASDPPLLATFFQNLDLLPAAGFPPADAVALLVMLALSRLEETRTGEQAGEL